MFAAGIPSRHSRFTTGPVRRFSGNQKAGSYVCSSTEVEEGIDPWKIVKSPSQSVSAQPQRPPQTVAVQGWVSSSVFSSLSLLALRISCLQATSTHPVTAKAMSTSPLMVLVLLLKALPTLSKAQSRNKTNYICYFKAVARRSDGLFAFFSRPFASHGAISC